MSVDAEVSIGLKQLESIRNLAGKSVIALNRTPHVPIASIDKVLPDIIYIRTSERLLFRRCRRLWGWNSPHKMNLEVASKPDYFWFGTGMHYALEDYHGVKQYGHPSVAFQAYTMATLAAKQAPDTWKELTSLGIEMMSYYADYWLSSRKRDSMDAWVYNGVPQTEVRFEIELPIRGPQGQRVMYRGTIDAMYMDEEGQLWVKEYKSAKAFRLHHFDTDDQITAYCWAAECIYGRPIAGVVYQQHRKQLPKPPAILASGKVSCNKQMSTSYAMYREVLMDVYGDPKYFPADNMKYLNDLAVGEESDADPFIRRDLIYRNQYQAAAQGEKILLEIEDILREDLPLYPNPSKDCSWLCPLESVCVAMDDGSDYESLLTALTVNREEVNESWRQMLPNPQDPSLQAPPQRSELLGLDPEQLFKEMPEPKQELLQLLELDW